MRLIKNTLIYGLASGLNSALPILLLPYLTRFLSPTEYGLIASLNTIAAFSNVVIGFNFHSYIFNKAFFHKDQPEYIGAIVANCMGLVGAFSLVAAVIAAVLSNDITLATGLPLMWILLIVFSSVFQFVISAYTAFEQSQNRPYHYLFVFILQGFLNVGLTIAGITMLDLGWQGRAWGLLLSIVCTGLYSFFILRKATKIKWRSLFGNPALRKTALLFSIPLVLHGIGGLLISMFDRLIISKKIGLAEAGLYHAGLQLSMIILFATDAFNKAFAPWLYESLSKNSAILKLQIVKLTYAIMGALILAVCLTQLIPDSVYSLVFSQNFVASKKYIFYAGIAYSFNGFYLLVCNYLFYTEKTKNLATVSLPVGLLNVFLSYQFVQMFGAMGALYSMCISYGLLFVLTWHQARQAFAMPWSLNLFGSNK